MYLFSRDGPCVHPLAIAWLWDGWTQGPSLLSGADQRFTVRSSRFSSCFPTPPHSRMKRNGYYSERVESHSLICGQVRFAAVLPAIMPI
jgi:hypothetical protein